MKNGFFKGHGLGNEYIVLDPAELTFRLTPGRIALLCDREQGLGSDGVLTLEDSDSADFGVRIWNPDGSEAETSGNGLRVFACYLHGTSRTRLESFTVETPGGTVRVETQRDCQGAVDDAETVDGDGTVGAVGGTGAAGRGGAVGKAGAVCAADVTGSVCGATVHMGRATFRPEALPCTLEVDELIDQPINVAGETQIFTGVSVGNPHCVVFHHQSRKWSDGDQPGRHEKNPRRHNDSISRRDDQFTKRDDSLQQSDDLSRRREEVLWQRNDLLRLGPALEIHPAFPKRTNVQLAEPTGPDSIRILIWERGAGETPSSGSSACAAASAAVRLDLVTSPVTVESPVGKLLVEVDEEFNLRLAGPVAEVARGTFNESMLRGILDVDH